MCSECATAIVASSWGRQTSQVHKKVSRAGRYLFVCSWLLHSAFGILLCLVALGKLWDLMLEPHVQPRLPGGCRWAKELEGFSFFLFSYHSHGEIVNRLKYSQNKICSWADDYYVCETRHILTCMCVHVCLCVHACVLVCVCACVCECVCMCVWVCVIFLIWNLKMTEALGQWQSVCLSGQDIDFFISSTRNKQCIFFWLPFLT